MKLLSLMLWAAGVLGYLPLVAGLALPKILNWNEDLAKLNPINQKIFLTYWKYVGAMIVTLPTLTLLFHDHFLRGDPMAQALAFIIAIFWTGRLVIDFVSYQDGPWPKGFIFKLGHLLLNTLFLFLALTYWSLFIWHLMN